MIKLYNYSKMVLKDVKPSQSRQLHNFKLIDNASSSGSDEESTNDDEPDTLNNELEQGWALIEQTINTRFSPEQVKFLQEKFEEGKNNGSKWDPKSVFEV